jgi:hypothetical protein
MSRRGGRVFGAARAADANGWPARDYRCAETSRITFFLCSICRPFAIAGRIGTDPHR